jgi:ketosteroid isomerase-like protein
MWPTISAALAREPCLEETIMSDSEMRALAKRFFDAVEQGDIDTLYASYAPDAKIWHNTDELEQSRDDNAETLKGFVKLISNRVYAKRRLSVFETGFVHQHELQGVRADGVKVHLPCCIVCEVKDGKITRLDEYFDSAQVAEFVKRANA